MRRNVDATCIALALTFLANRAPAVAQDLPAQYDALVLRADHPSEHDPSRDPYAESSPPDSAVGLLWENDIFAQTDRHYTNGVRLGFLLPPPETLAEAVDRGLGRSCDWGIVAGQQIFTPEDLSSDEPTSDRPYAGWLYAGIVLRLRGGGAWDDADGYPVLDVFELDVGFLGHASLAADAQTAIHRLTSSDPPKGWKAHVCEGVGVQLAWTRQVRLLRVAGAPLGLELDVVPHAGVVLGNIVCAARVGGTVRLGWGLTGDFGGLAEDVLALPLAPRDAPRARSQPFGVWLVGRVDVRASAFDLTVEGTPMGAVGPVVRREPIVASAEAGLVVSLGDGVMFGYTHTFRTAEFADQSGFDAFGGLFLHVGF